MRARAILLGFLSICCLLVLAATTEDSSPLGGYSATTSKTEREWETKFRAIPSPQNLRDYMQRLAAHPHHVGSPYDKDNAEWMQAKFKEWGLDAHIESFDVLFPTPKTRLLEMVEPTKFVAKLQEPALAVDPTSNQMSEQLPTYNAYSVDGDVTGPLVYVNYGTPDDYEKLDRLGVSVKGAIVIARYGNSWRGIKPKVAAEHGAIGCLIYSDPKDDGYGPDDVFPAGPMRPKDGAQRGSVADMPTYPGDPLTPGVGATKNAKRLELKDAKTLTHIPVLPISYGDAQPMLAALKGEVAPEEWRGGLGQTYHVGPGATKVHLKLQFNWELKPLYDVIVNIPGTDQADQWIVRGNHHDAWVNGAEDPVSGANALMEEARGLGELLKQGWKPKRTIIYCVWDGEEPGLLGSTEWAETHADELRQHAVVYINSDGNDRGYLNAGGSHTLERFVNGVARDIEDPEKKITVWQRTRLKRLADADSAENRKDVRNRATWRIEALGSGSDFTPFLQHLGVAALDLGYGGEGDEGIYHSIYDDFERGGRDRARGVRRPNEHHLRRVRRRAACGPDMGDGRRHRVRDGRDGTHAGRADGAPGHAGAGRPARAAQLPAAVGPGRGAWGDRRRPRADGAGRCGRPGGGWDGGRRGRRRRRDVMGAESALTWPCGGGFVMVGQARGRQALLDAFTAIPGRGLRPAGVWSRWRRGSSCSTSERRRCSTSARPHARCRRGGRADRCTGGRPAALAGLVLPAAAAARPGW